jgi:hypothetical protein
MTSLLGCLPPSIPFGWVSFERTEGQRGSESNGYNGASEYESPKLESRAVGSGSSYLPGPAASHARGMRP